MNFSVLDWNIQGKKYYTCTSLKKVKPVLEESGADIICLQEGREIIEKINCFARLKNYHYVFSHEDEDGTNVILSKLPIIASGMIIPPSFTNKSSGKALWADIEIDQKTIRVYNCHLGIVGVGPKERAEALKFVLNDAKNKLSPVIICGDFNTTIPAKGLGRKFVRWFHHEPSASFLIDKEFNDKDERYYLNEIIRQEKFREVTDISKSTWSILRIKWEIFHLKLDWFIVRDLETTEVILNKYVSDHRAIFVRCVIN